MNPEIKSKWVAALRGGEYRQGVASLRHQGTKGDEFCCLGVLCDLHSKETGGKWSDEPTCAGEFRYGTETLLLPKPVIDWAGLTEATPTGNVEIGPDERLADYNDGTFNKRRHSLNQIADLIEKHL